MANKITGTTDITGAASVVSKSSKSILLVGKTTATDAVAEVIKPISGTTDVINLFGSTSPFVEIVKVLVKNGVGNIKGIAIGAYDGDNAPYDALADAYEGAFEVSMMDDYIDCIITDSTDATINSVLSDHLDSAESQDMFRYAVVGCPTGKTTTEVKAIASAIDSSRIFIGYPNMVNESGTELDGAYTAAGIASKIVTETNDPALPVSGVAISGFGGVASKLTPDDQDDLADSGVVVVYPDKSVPTIYKLVTTAAKTSNVMSIWHDATTRFIADFILATVENKLRANYKRTKNVARILDAIKTDVISVLQDANGLEIIRDFDKSTVSVIRDPNDTYGALVDYEFKVVTPLYTITITQHVKV